MAIGSTNAQTAQSGGGARYSTTEQWTGRYWLDGSKIYCMCAYPTASGRLANNAFTSVRFDTINSTATPDINDFIKCEFKQPTQTVQVSSGVLCSTIRQAKLEASGVAVWNIGTQSDIDTNTVFYFEYTKV